MAEDKVSQKTKETVKKSTGSAETVDKSTVSVIFRQNRKFDLHIGREVTVFKARERKDIPKKWLEHEDWKNVAKYFIVQGV